MFAEDMKVGHNVVEGKFVGVEYKQVEVEHKSAEGRFVGVEHKFVGGKFVEVERKFVGGSQCFVDNFVEGILHLELGLVRVGENKECTEALVVHVSSKRWLKNNKL